MPSERGRTQCAIRNRMPIELSDSDAKPGARLGSRKDRAAQHAAELAPIIAEIRATGVTSLYGIAKALNGRGVPTATGKGKWQDIGIRRVLTRLGVGLQSPGERPK